MRIRCVKRPRGGLRQRCADSAVLITIFFLIVVGFLCIAVRGCGEDAPVRPVPTTTTTTRPTVIHTVPTSTPRTLPATE